MNCDDFLEVMSSDNERQSSAAKVHAESCPSCAALAEVRARLKKELAATEPLQRRLRAVWEAVANDSSQTTSIIESVQVRLASEGRNFASQLGPLRGSASLLFVVSAAAGVLVLIFVPLACWFIYGDQASVQPGGGNLPAPPVVVRQIDATAELTDLLAEVNALEDELDKTLKQAELLDARHQADVLLATHSQW